MSSVARTRALWAVGAAAAVGAAYLIVRRSRYGKEAFRDVRELLAKYTITVASSRQQCDQGLLRLCPSREAPPYIRTPIRCGSEDNSSGEGSDGEDGEEEGAAAGGTGPPALDPKQSLKDRYSSLPYSWEEVLRWKTWSQGLEWLDGIDLTPEEEKELPGRVVVPHAMGLDAEWKPEKGTRMATLQLALPPHCLILRLHQMPATHSGPGRPAGGDPEQEFLPPSLYFLLESPIILKLGVAINGDAKKLRNDWSATFEGGVGLEAMAGSAGRGGGGLGLKSLAKHIVGYSYSQSLMLARMSNWERPLTPVQQEYAAADAVVGFHIAEALWLDSLSAEGVEHPAEEEGVVAGILATKGAYRGKGPEGESAGRHWGDAFTLASDPMASWRLFHRYCDFYVGVTYSAPGSGGSGKAPKRAPRQHIRPARVSRKTPLFQNVHVEDKDGRLLGIFARQKVAQQVVLHGHAEVREDEPDRYCVRLTIPDSVNWPTADPYHMQPKQNVCCGCGATEELMTTHIIPSSYTKNLNRLECEHDSVLTCLNCTPRGKGHYRQMTRQLAEEFNAPIGGRNSSIDLRDHQGYQAKRKAKCLLDAIAKESGVVASSAQEKRRQKEAAKAARKLQNKSKKGGVLTAEEVAQAEAAAAAAAAAAATAAAASPASPASPDEGGEPPASAEGEGGKKPKKKRIPEVKKFAIPLCWSNHSLDKKLAVQWYHVSDEVRCQPVLDQKLKLPIEVRRKMLEGVLDHLLERQEHWARECGPDAATSGMAPLCCADLPDDFRQPDSRVDPKTIDAKKLTVETMTAEHLWTALCAEDFGMIFASHSELVADQIRGDEAAELAFMRRWREMFLRVVAPRHLPAHWAVDYVAPRTPLMELFVRNRSDYDLGDPVVPDMDVEGEEGD